MLKTFIKREKYLKAVRLYSGPGLIKVITGQRRVGKSYLLFQIMDELREKGIRKENIVYINKELNEFENIRNSRDLLKYIGDKKIKGKKAVFIDEIQEISEFEKALRSMQAEGNSDIYCTGSNARLLSGELATFLSGRHIELRVHGLSYGEFLRFHKCEESPAAFMRYLRIGGLPYLINISPSDDAAYEYLRSIYNSILLKDIVGRYNVRHVDFIERLVEFLADNTGSIVSAKRISDFLKSQKIAISPGIILNYLSFLSSAFMVSRVRRSDIKGRKIFEVGEKYYFGDMGIRHSIIGFRQNDISKVLENIVFLHLLSSGYTITVGKLGDKEVDFVCEKNGEREYVQVAYLLSSESAREREFGNLLAINDNYPKTVISMDEMSEKSFKGVRQINIREFLLSHS